MFADSKIEYLELQVQKNAALEELLKHAAVVELLGPEGITEVANTQPQLILSVLSSLVTALKQQIEETNALTDDYFESLDNFESLNNTLRKMLENLK